MIVKDNFWFRFISHDQKICKRMWNMLPKPKMIGSLFWNDMNPYMLHNFCINKCPMASQSDSKTEATSMAWLIFNLACSLLLLWNLSTTVACRQQLSFTLRMFPTWASERTPLSCVPTVSGILKEIVLVKVHSGGTSVMTRNDGASAGDFNSKGLLDGGCAEVWDVGAWALPPPPGWDLVSSTVSTLQPLPQPPQKLQEWGMIRLERWLSQ